MAEKIFEFANSGQLFYLSVIIAVIGFIYMLILRPKLRSKGFSFLPLWIPFLITVGFFSLLVISSLPQGKGPEGGSILFGALILSVFVTPIIFVLLLIFLDVLVIVWRRRNY